MKIHTPGEVSFSGSAEARISTPTAEWQPEDSKLEIHHGNELKELEAAFLSILY